MEVFEYHVCKWCIGENIGLQVQHLGCSSSASWLFVQLIQLVFCGGVQVQDKGCAGDNFSFVQDSTGSFGI